MLFKNSHGRTFTNDQRALANSKRDRQRKKCSKTDFRVTLLSLQYLFMHAQFTVNQKLLFTNMYKLLTKYTKKAHREREKQIKTVTI